MTDPSPAGAPCFIDDLSTTDEDGETDQRPPLCGDNFTATDLEDGPHRLTVLALDDQDNATFETFDFTVDANAPEITLGRHRSRPGHHLSNQQHSVPMRDGLAWQT